jgi:hypothetical protein
MFIIFFMLYYIYIIYILCKKIRMYSLHPILDESVQMTRILMKQIKFEFQKKLNTGLKEGEFKSESNMESYVDSCFHFFV